MSKTRRKRAESYEEYCGKSYFVWDYKNKLKKDIPYYYDWTRSYTIIGFVDYGWESYKEDEAKYYSDNMHRGCFRRSKPRDYRRIVNKMRRNHDKRELWKETHFEGYEGLYSKWNASDADPAWYW